MRPELELSNAFKVGGSSIVAIRIHGVCSVPHLHHRSIELIEISKLKPALRNARTHSNRQITSHPVRRLGGWHGRDRTVLCRLQTCLRQRPHEGYGNQTIPVGN
jgi:hypothetical protein